MARYALADHVFVCVNGEHLVLLDVKEDRYWALEAAQTSGFSAWVGGWPVNAPGEVSAAAPAPETEAAIEVLRGRGLLTDSVPPGKDATPVAATPPARELLTDSEAADSRKAGSSLSFFVASALAKIALRTWPFERVIRRVRQRKAMRSAQAAPLDVERARRLVETFMRYRIFLFSSKNECLYDSLALIEFLARNGIQADWVFGVQTRPFAAHCWVQHGDIVFNDTVEHVSGYTPIMVV
jgi:transglutaminase-like putative cysteine protease